MSIPKQLHGIPTVEEVHEISAWIDSLLLSRQRRNMSRDFSDGVLVAEIVHHFHPSLVELHNYQATSSPGVKLRNWETLNMKVFKKLGFGLHPKDFEGCANVTPGMIEKVLKRLRLALESGPVTGRLTTPSLIDSDKRVYPPSIPDQLVNKNQPALKADPLEVLRTQLTGQTERIADLERTVEILQLKNSKLEQLLEVKDKKIEALKRASHVD